MEYVGSCHCGSIQFSASGELGKVIECNCSHCSRKGYLLWFVPRDQFTLTTPEESLSTYTFNSHVIKHHFCSACGCAPFGFGEGPSGPMASINARCLEGVELSELEVEAVDGRSF